MNLQDLFSSDIDWWQLLIALLVAVTTLVVSRLARKGILALMRRAPGVTEPVATFVSRFVGYAVLLLGLGIALAVLGANIQPLLAIAIVLAVIAVLVLRGVADNFAAGVLLQARQTVKVGDEVVVDGPDGALTGTVTELNARSVLLLTVDGRTVHVPNARLLADPLINDSSHGARRSEVQVRVRHGGAALDDVVDVVSRAAATAEGVHHREIVRALITGVSDSRFTIRLQYWHHPLHGAVTTSGVVVAVSAALADAGWTGTVTSEPGAPPLVPPEAV
ncbi:MULTISPECIES: mechanosensitive ion channel family protein [unclassified Microbacterium]|uniref:mechanosensitive ion channel family protein n=1 Tax=unclassified Microbacterium TaxID=2609290 RepID=UPI0030183FB2